MHVLRCRGKKKKDEEEKVETDKKGLKAKLLILMMLLDKMIWFCSFLSVFFFSNLQKENQSESKQWDSHVAGILRVFLFDGYLFLTFGRQYFGNFICLKDSLM